jgi:hypothetical protein
VKIADVLRKLRCSRKKIFLHCGLHKTGTTSLQRFLHSNRSLLGYAYPETGLFSYGHHNLAWELADDQRFSTSYGNIADLLTEISRTNQEVILSSEDFEGCIANTPRFRKFANCLWALNFRPIIIVYLRSQDFYATSLYFELLKHGYHLGFSDFIDEIIATGTLKFRAWRFMFDYEQLLKLLRRTGCEHWIRHYSELPRTDTVQDFCQLLDINVTNTTSYQQDNAKIGVHDAYSHFLKNAHMSPQLDLSNQPADIGTNLRRRLAAHFNRKNRILKLPFEIRPYSLSESSSIEQVFSLSA